MKTLAPKAEDRYERAADLASELRDVRFRVAGAASPAAELAAMVKNQFPPAEHDRIALEAPAPPLPAPAPVLAPVASSSAGPRQRSFVEISTAAGFMPFQGPGAAVAPDAAINQLLVPPDETRVLRKPPPAQPALAPPPPPPPPAARAKKAKRPSTVELRDERSARLHRELFDDVSSLQRAPGERPPTVSKLPTSPAAAVMAGAQLPGVTDDAPTRFHQAAPPAKPSENTDEIDEDDEVESERARRVRIGVVLGALTLIVVIILAWAAGYLG